MKRKNFNTLAMICAVIALVSMATWIVPGGEYARETKNRRTLVLLHSFHYVENSPQGIGALLLSPLRGFVQAANIIGFLFVIGGTFSVIQKTGTLVVSIQRMAFLFAKKPAIQKYFIPSVMTLFSIGGSIFGSIGCARAILVIATDGKIMDTMLYGMSEVIKNLHPINAAQVMFLAQCVVNFFVHSASGQAMLTMPVMAPLADAVGISRQTAVLAFQFGEGWINPILPTSGVTMGVLGMAGIPWDKWFKWMLPLQVVFLVLAVLLLIPPFFIGW